jgi:hypothetical protein
MERLAVLLEQLDLPEISRLLRHTLYAAILVAIVGLVAFSIAGYPIAGIGGCVGLAFGLVNIRLVMSTAARLNASGVQEVKRPMALNTLGRLGATTVVAIVCLLISLQFGMGVVAGIAVFYFLFVASLIRTLLHQGQHGVVA